MMTLAQTPAWNAFDINRDVRMTCSPLGGQRLVTVAPRRGPEAATVLLLHGLGDYAARQLGTARWLARRGYRTILFDLAGHGGSVDERKFSGWIEDLYARHDSSEAVLRALRADSRLGSAGPQAFIDAQFHRLSRTHVADHVAQVSGIVDMLLEGWKASGTPIVLAGHSLGALLAVETVWRLAPHDRAAIAGVVMLAPALQPQGNPDSALMRLVVGGIWGLRRAPLSLTRTAFKAALELNFPVDTTWGTKWLSDQKVERDLFATDPLMPHQLPTRYASSIESQMAETARRGFEFPVPGLVLVPSRDGITSRSAGIRFAQNVNTAAGAGRMRLVRLPVAAHDLLRSSARDQAQAVIGNWIDERVLASALRDRQMRRLAS